IRVRKQNEEWTEDYLKLNIIINPPFYLSTVAIILYILIVVGVALLIVVFYIRKIKAEGLLRLEKLEHAQYEKLNTERLNFFTNITHELRTPLTLILGPLDDH